MLDDQTIMLEQWGANVDNCGVIGLGCEKFLAWGLRYLSAGGLSWIVRPPREDLRLIPEPTIFTLPTEVYTFNSSAFLKL